MHELEVGEVDAVLHDVLRMDLQSGPEQGGRRHRWVVVVGRLVVAEVAEDVRHVEVRCTTAHVVPDPHRRVTFQGWIAADATTLVRVVLVGHTHVAALGVPLPAVERAHQTLALHMPTVAEVCPEVFAVSVEDDDSPRRRTPGHHLLPEVLHRVHVAHADLGRPGDLEPAGGLHGQRCLRHEWTIEPSVKVCKKVL